LDARSKAKTPEGIMHTFEVVRDVFSKLTPYKSVAGSEGLLVATLISADHGAVHVELSVCELQPGGYVAGHYHPFEESFHILDGQAQIGIDGTTYDLVKDDFGFVPFATAHAWRNLSSEPVRWYRIRSPQPRRMGGSDGTYPAPGYQFSGTPRQVAETDPTCRYVGHFDVSEMGDPGSLSMPGYHGANVNDVSCRMMIDDVLGAIHHTNFMIQFAPRVEEGQSGSGHYHGFEEAYLLVAGQGEATMEGQTFQVQAGDLVWGSTGAMHAWVNRGSEPLRFIEMQAPRPAFSNMCIFEQPWNDLEHHHVEG
jgi:quercetin dioxygenase-like cupin family protein